MSNARGPRESWLICRMACEGIPVRAIARILNSDLPDVERQLRIAVRNGNVKTMPPEEWPENTRIDTRVPAPAAAAAVDELYTLAWRIHGFMKLTMTEGMILGILLNRGRVDSTTLRAVSDGGAGNWQSLKVHMSHIRAKLAVTLPAVKIETVHGWGYCVDDESRRLINKFLNGGTLARKSRIRRKREEADSHAIPVGKGGAVTTAA